MHTKRAPKPRSEAWRWVSHYGSASNSWGILVEHMTAAGLIAHIIADGRLIVAIDGKVVPVLCSEVIPVTTEDGPSTGRCGIALQGDTYACPGHTAEREGWLALTEADKAIWERRADEVAR